MSDLGDLPADQARLWMHRVAGWAAEYREKIEEQRITPDVAPGDIAAGLPPAPPEHGEKLAAIFDDFERLIMPGIVHWGHPAFLGYFGSTTTAPGILGDWLAAALNVSAMTWRTSPAATELETTVLGWIRGMVGITEAFEGVVYDTASVATLHALAAAREATGLDVRRRGLSGAPKLLIYASEQAHSSVDKAAVMLGLGEDSVRRIETDPELRMRPAALRAAVARDVHARLRPFAVVATVGTTSSAAVDPVPAIADVCAEQRLWLHVDAAYGGALAVLPEGRWVMDGVTRADSVVVNPHKWLFVPLDFSALYTRRPEMLRAVFSLVPEYLSGDAEHAERNYMDYGIQLGRRFRALKAWMVLRAFGRAGIEARIREHVRLARQFADWVEADPDFELAAPVTMAVVCFRARPAGMADEDLDALNTRIVAQACATGRVYLTHTRLDGRVAMRVAVGNVLTTERHLAEAWAVIHDAFDRTLLG
ncbi:MAG TPA: pyridoxal-dependent decarboxylase [Methylomirabilota bacterium]|nr:pyridoxal-dependent decarboxylase [Methylomirabilota bacterium]